MPSPEDHSPVLFRLLGGGRELWGLSSVLTWMGLGRARGSQTAIPASCEQVPVAPAGAQPDRVRELCGSSLGWGVSVRVSGDI